MGTGMTNSIPNFWEREREWQILFPTFGNGNETLLFPGMIGNGNGNGVKKSGQNLYVVVEIRGVFYITLPLNFLHCKIYKYDELCSNDLFKYFINKSNAENIKKINRMFVLEMGMLWHNDDNCCIAYSCGSSEHKELLSAISRKFRGVSCPEFHLSWCSH